MSDILEGLLTLPKEEMVYEGDIVEETKKLTDAFSQYTTPHTFKPGDIVRWKLGLRNRSLPYGRPMVVVGFAPEGTANPVDDPFTAYFKENLNIIVGTYAWNGDFITYYIDSARIELHDGKIKDEELALKKEKDTSPVVSKSKGLPKEEIEELLKKYDENHSDDDEGP